MSIASLYPSINPSLLLDFANSKVLDPRITFTRTTSATYYDGVTTAMAEQNGLLYSQTFDLSPWVTYGSPTITANNQTAPDGTSTADTIVLPSGGDIVRQPGSISAGSNTFTFSIYLKLISGSGTVTLRLLQPDYSGVLASAVVTPTGSWVRYTVTGTYSGSISGNASVDFIGNGSASITVAAWGAQLEQRASATAYTATTTQAITNYIPVLQTASAGQARFDHNPTTGESLGLLIEEQRTNVFTYSADFSDSIWAKGNSSVTANTIVAPDGTLTGDKLVENTATGSHNIVQNYTGTATLTSSVYAKPAGRSAFVMNGGNQSGVAATFDVSAGTVSNVGGAVTGTSITSVGNGWYRCSMTWSNTSTVGLGIFLVSGGSTSYTGDGFSGLYLWGAQLEAGAFPTSYIATTSATVTRNADAASMTGTNFSSWFNNGEGSYVINGSVIAQRSGGKNGALQIDGGSTSNMITTLFDTDNHFLVYVNGSATCAIDAGTVAAGTTTLFAGGYQVNSFGAVINGGTVGSDTSGNVPNGLNRMLIGLHSTEYLNGRLAKVAYYPKRLTNAQLQALTV
jgi:hypothetical protein